MNEFCMPNVDKYFQELEDIEHQPIIYLNLVKHYFDDYTCRQIYFVCAKRSIKKHFPKDFPKVDNLRSENLSIKQIEELIKKYEEN